MKVLFFITDLGVGGAERQVVDLADRFAGKGAQVKIAYLTGDASVRPSNHDIELIGFGVDRSLYGLISGYIRLRQLIRRFRPDVVHSHMVHANLLARVVRITTSIPQLISTAHSTNEGGKLRMMAYYVTDFLANTSTNVSEEAVEVFEEKRAVPRGRMIAVPNGIDTDRFHFNAELRGTTRTAMKLAADEKVILAVGRLVPAKDYPNLLRAFAQVDRRSRKLALWIVGAGDLLPELERLADELEIAGEVKFLGMRRDVPALLNAADIYVLSSAWEGLPLVIGESMASEKVVVATDCGGVREVLSDCGFLVPSKQPAALAAGLEQALKLGEPESAQFGARARARIVESYSLDSSVAIWSDVYAGKRVLGSRMSSAQQ
jgi:glycosyltransferase involved in cell wall biosynthesis